VKGHKLPPFRAPQLPMIPAFGSGAGPSPQLNDSLAVQCPKAATLGTGYTVSGTLGPKLSGQQIALVYRDGANVIVKVLSTDASGSFTDTVNPGQTGTWTVSAGWPGNLTYHQAFSAACATDVAPQQTALTLTCPGTASVQGEVAVGGTLSAGPTGAPITITYSEPSGTVVDTVVTDVAGDYTDSVLAVPSGTWHIQASYAGDAKHASSTSGVCTTIVS
jgi:hypothetical protein